MWWKEIEVGGWGGYCFVKKLCYVKRKLVEWNRSTFGLLKENKHKLSVELQSIDSRLEEIDSDSEELRGHNKEVMAEMEMTSKAEEMYWHQKVKCKWLKEGDENTSFFYKMAYGWKRKTMISSLVVEEEVVTNFENIANEATSFYENLYKKGSFWPSIYRKPI